jgi:Icc-related predicted phosphoesterase
MKILNISDTHGFHFQLDSIIKNDKPDMIIHAGDFSNWKNPVMNLQECLNFLAWFNSLDSSIIKVLIAGNHDTAIEAGLLKREEIEELGIHYLFHESKEINGIEIFGSPYTPEFCGWAFNVARHKLQPYWDAIPDTTDILVTHGPPKGILDLSRDIEGTLEYCGDKSLLNAVLRIEPRYHIFGHIHDSTENYNSGTRTLSGISTTFINASCVTDRKFENGLTSFGTRIEF